ncbi:MAG: RyR domain-containing protein [Rikenellaceae bacterium]
MKQLLRIISERIDSAIAGGTKAQIGWLTLFVVVLISIFSAVAITCNVEVFGSSDTPTKIQGVIYHFLDQGNQSMEQGQSLWAQIFTFVISFFGMIFLNGMLISALSNTIERRVSNIERGLVTYKSLNDHIVIIGYSEMTTCLINNILEEHKYDSTIAKFFPRLKMLRSIPQMVVFTNKDVEMVRVQIYSQLPKGAEQLVLFYAGSIESEEHLSRLNIATASSLYILGDDGEYGRDSKNLACINHISNLRGEREPLQVNVQFDLLPSYSNIKKLVIPKEYITPKGSAAQSAANIYFRPFNFYENWARLVWSTYADATKYKPLDFEQMEGDKHVHLVIVGFHRMGRAMFLEALRLCHYANYDAANPATCTKITVVDKDLDEQLASFKSQYPALEEQITDIEIEYIGAHVEDARVEALIDSAARDSSALLTVAICLNDPDLSLSTGLSLPESCYFLPERIEGDKKNITANNMRTNILIRQELQHGLGEILDKDNDRFKNVKIFGMLTDGVSQQLFNDDLPMYINHNYNLLIESKQLLPLYLAGEVDLDLAAAKADWIELSENMRWSNRYQVDAFASYIKALAALGVTRVEHLADLDSKLLEPLAETEHRRWMAERTVSGWRQIRPKEGEVRMDKFQHHTLFVPYDQLDQTEKDKDSEKLQFYSPALAF